MNTGVTVAFCQQNIEAKHIECTYKAAFCLMYFYFVYRSMLEKVLTNLSNKTAVHGCPVT